MLLLKRVIYQTDFSKCDLSNEIIGYGDYYYYDTESGKRIKKSVYDDIHRAHKEETFDRSKLELAKGQRDYEEMLKEATRELMANEILYKNKFVNPY